jgi:amidase
LQDYRVAVLLLFPWLPVENEILDARDRLADRLRRLGMNVEDTKPEALGDGRAYYQLYFSLMAVVISLTMPTRTRRLSGFGTRLSRDDFVAAWGRGLRATAADYVSWYAQREHYRESYRRFFRDWDVMLAPACISNAFPHPNLRVPITRRRLDVDGQSVPYLRLNVYPSLATLCGQPAAAFPVGQTRAGLPIGLQVIGPYLEDRTTIRFAHLLEQEFGGLRRAPNCRD